MRAYSIVVIQMASNHLTEVQFFLGPSDMKNRKIRLSLSKNNLRFRKTRRFNKTVRLPGDKTFVLKWPKQRVRNEFDAQFKTGQKIKYYYATSNSAIDKLELRLDVITVRLCFASSIFQARNLIRRGHILVNNTIINHPSHVIELGDTITCDPLICAPTIIQSLVKFNFFPKHLFKPDSFTGVLTQYPSIENILLPSNISPSRANSK
jgi:ribosomal protein S4